MLHSSSTPIPMQGEYLGKDETKAESIYSHPDHQTTYDTYLYRYWSKATARSSSR